MSARILIADDSRTVRRSLHGLLEQNPKWKVFAEAVDGADVIAKAQQFKPDIIGLGFFMPGMTGVEAARVLGRVLPSVPILIFNVRRYRSARYQAKRVGIKGAVEKSDTRAMVNGIAALLRKETFFNRQ